MDKEETHVPKSRHRSNAKNVEPESITILPRTLKMRLPAQYSVRGRNATAKPIAPVVNFKEKVGATPPKGGPVGGPMDAKRSTYVHLRRNKTPKKINDAIEGHVAEVMQQIAVHSKMSPSQ